MLKNKLIKSMAGAIAVGGMLTASVVSGPAVVSSAPTIKNVACEGYPASVATSTALSVRRSVSMYGAPNSATARVTRDESGTAQPRGSVTFRIVGVGAWVKRLDGGEASVRFPRLPARRTYTVRARYNPPTCSVFAASASAPAYTTVVRAKTGTSVVARNVRRGVRPFVWFKVVSATGAIPNGRARVVVSHKAVNVRARYVTLNRNGAAVVRFPVLRPGYYNVDVRYFTTPNFGRSQGTDDFRVFRR